MTALLVASSVFALCLISAGKFYDISYDGQAYHQEAILQLSAGWNPWQKILGEGVPHYKILNHYPKSSEILASLLYLVTGNIEAGKAWNLILIVVSWLVCAAALPLLGRMGHWQSLLLSAIAAMNPVAVYQSLSYYVDGQMASLWLIGGAAAALYLGQGSLRSLLILSISLVLMVTIKFTGWLWAALLVAMAYLLLIFLKRRAQWIRLTIAILAALVMSLFLIGFNPYMTNLLNGYHPMHPVMGREAMDVMGDNLPEVLKPYNPLQRLWWSLASASDNPIGPASNLRPKIPFFLTSSWEWRVFGCPDTRIGGFGPWFSGIMLLSLVGLFWWLLSAHRPANGWLLAFLIVIAASILLFRESWWARYVPQLWLWPLVIAAMIIPGHGGVRTMGFLIIAAALINVTMVSIPYLSTNLRATKEIESILKRVPRSTRVEVYYGDCRANRSRFQRLGIVPKIVASKDSLGSESISFPGSSCRFIIK